MANAASITRQIKKITDNPEIAVRTVSTHRDVDGTRVYLWQSFVFVGLADQEALTAKFAAAGLDDVTASDSGFLSVCQPR